MSLYHLLRPLLFALDAERAHGLTLGLLDLAEGLGLGGVASGEFPPLRQDLLGLHFPNPVGIAAGLDKDGRHIDALAALGPGFIEIGTVTPKPQAGNPKPRLFRLPEHQAIINRFGFNNAGVDVLVKNAEAARYKGVLGINIGKNKDTPNESALDDYRLCLERVYPRASYVTVNLSSPNTAGLRELQQAEAMRHLLGGLLDSREQLAGRHGRKVPLLVKIAPDLAEAELDAIALALLDTGIDGIIATNTTIAHEDIFGGRHAYEQGGLSGRPLMQRATAVLAGLRTRLGDALPLIGVGGILDGGDAADKIRAGASLVQLYSGLVYRGPELIGEAVQEIAVQHGERLGSKA